MRARLLLLGAALAAFGGSLFAGFHFDDYAIFSGPALKPWSWPHPLVNATFWLNAGIGGQDPLGYHVFNLLLHLGAVLLAYECLRRLLPPTAAVLAAAIFAVHPLQAEAVNYVAMRGVMLGAVFCFAALLAWLAGQRWIGFAAFIAAVYTSEQCALFPVVFLLIRAGTPPLRKAAGAAVSSGFFIAGLELAHASWKGYAYAGVSLRFLRLFLVPWGFTITPDVHEPLRLSLAIALWIILAALCIWYELDYKSPWTWFVAGLVLLIPSPFANPAMDARMYLPMFAFAAAAGLLLERLPERRVAIAIVAILAVVSVSRTYVWMSDERLWREALRRAPDQVEPKIQLAKWLKAADALELLGRARDQAPYNPEIPAEAGKILLDEQQYDGAIDELSRAVALNPKNALAFNNRGVALSAVGQIPAATADFQHALSIDPNLSEASENLKRLSGR